MKIFQGNTYLAIPHCCQPAVTFCRKGIHIPSQNFNINKLGKPGNDCCTAELVAPDFINQLPEGNVEPASRNDRQSIIPDPVIFLLLKHFFLRFRGENEDVGNSAQQRIEPLVTKEIAAVNWVFSPCSPYSSVESPPTCSGFRILQQMHRGSIQTTVHGMTAALGKDRHAAFHKRKNYPGFSPEPAFSFRNNMKK